MPDVALLNNLQPLSRAAVDRLYAEMPELADRYGPRGRAKCLEDTEFTIRYLAEAVWLDDHAIFLDYLRWAQTLMAAHGVELNHFTRSLEHLRDVVPQHVPADRVSKVTRCLEFTIAALPAAADCPSCEITPGSDLGDLARDYLEALLDDNGLEAERLITQAVIRGTPLRDLYVSVFVPVQREVGRLWQTRAISVAREHYCTGVTSALMRTLALDVLFRDRPRKSLRVLCAGVSGELHDLGLRTVSDLFEAEGWRVSHYGAQTPAASLAAEAARLKPNLIALSATLPIHLRTVALTITQIRESCPGVYIIVGGRAFRNSAALAQRIGADAFAPDAAAAVDLARTRWTA